MELLLLWVWLQKALPRHIAPGFPPCMSISKTFCLDGKLQGKVIPWEDHAWVTEQPTALLKELASKRGAQCEVHLVPGKAGKQKHPSVYQLFGFGIQTLSNWEREDLAT